MTAFIRERCRVGNPDATVAIELLYQGYRLWCQDRTGAKNPAPRKHSAAISKPPSQVSECHGHEMATTARASTKASRWRTKQNG